MSTNIVKLNIGGTVFQTTKSTLTKYDGFFKTLLETDVSVEKDEFGCVFVDRDPLHFRFILNFMRDGDVILPDSEKEVQEILKEAQYYLLQGLIELCGGEPPEPVETEAKSSIGVRVVETSEEMEQLRDETKPLLLLRYAEELTECFLEPYNSVSFFVQKHESRFDIFFQRNEGSLYTIDIKFPDGKTVQGSPTAEKNLENLFSLAEFYIEEFCN